MVSKLMEAAATAVQDGQDPNTWVAKHMGMIATRFSDLRAADRFAESVTSLIEGMPVLARCTPESVLGCIMLAANLRLDLSPLLGEFHISTKVVDTPTQERVLIAVPIIGYQGYAKLAYNTGRVEKIETLFIREGDEWDMWADSDKGRQFLWRPKDDDEGRKWDRVVALVKIIGAGTVWATLTRSQVEARRQESQFWLEHFDAMARKTAIRELAPLMPKSVDLATAIVSDEQHVEKVEGVDEVVTR